MAKASAKASAKAMAKKKAATKRPKKKFSEPKNPAAEKNNFHLLPGVGSLPPDQPDSLSPVFIGGARPQLAGMPTPLPAIPPIFPADLLSHLHKAAESGRYMIAVFTADEIGNLELFRSTAGSYSYDWWLRSAALLRQDIANSDPPGMTDGSQADGLGQNEIHPAAGE